MRPRLIRARAFGRKAVQVFAVLALTASCGPLSRFDAVPIEAEQQAAIPNMRDIRFWGDGDATQLAVLSAAGNASIDRDIAYLAASGHQGPLPPVHALAISGGGELRPDTRSGSSELRFVWSRADATDSLTAPLRPVVRSAAELLTSDLVDRVRECHGDDCTWLFLDQSRNRSRRWCSMESCGNRAKVRRHYRRRQGADG